MRTLRPLRYLVVFACLFLLGDRVFSAALGHLVSRSEFRFSRLYRGGLDYDVLVLGDSRAVHSVFAPDMSERLCRTVLNLGYNGMSAEIAEAILRDYLDANAPPKAVLIEVSNVLQDNDLLQDLRLYARSPSHLASLMRQEDPWTARWIAVSHLYAFNNEMMLRALYYLGHGDQDWILGSDNQMSAAFLANLRPELFPTPRSRPAEVAALKRIIGELRARHIEPVLFIAPYYPAYRKFEPDFVAWERGLQRDVGEDNPIMDLSQSVRAAAAFADILHVNFTGSRSILGQLAGRLSAALPPGTDEHCLPPVRTATTLTAQPISNDVAPAH